MKLSGRTKIIYVSRSEIEWLEAMFPECSAWGFDCKEYLDAQALAHELDDQYEASDFENNLYIDISTAHDEGFDVVKFEFDGGGDG